MAVGCVCRGGGQHLSLRLLQRAGVEAKKEKGSVCFATFDVRRADEEPHAARARPGPRGARAGEVMSVGGINMKSRVCNQDGGGSTGSNTCPESI